MSKVQEGQGVGIGKPHVPPASHATSFRSSSEHNTFELQTIVHGQESSQHDASLQNDGLNVTEADIQSIAPGTATPATTVGAESDGELLASNLAPVDGGLHALLFLFGSWLLEFVIWGHAYSYGAYQAYHLYNTNSPLYGQSSTAISAIGTVVIGVQCFVPLLTRGFSRTFPHFIRSATLVCIAISVLALIASSFMTKVVPLIVLQTVYGLSSGTAFTPVILYLNQWWDKRRGLATGIIFAGSGVGGIVFPLAITALLDHIGFGWTMRFVALLTAILAGGATFCVKPRLPIPAASRHAVRQMSRMQLLKHLLPGDLRPLIGRLAGSFEVTVFAQSCAWYTISLYIPTYCTSLGFSSSTATGVLSAFNAAAVVGYMIVGPLIDRTSYTLLMACSQVVCSLSAFLLLGFAHSLVLILLFVLSFGVGGGGFTTFLTPIARDLASLSPRQEFATVYLAFVFLRGVASVVGPLVGTALYTPPPQDAQQPLDFTLYGAKGFRGIVLYVGSLMLIGTAFTSIASWQRRVDLRKAGDAIRQRWQAQ